MLGGETYAFADILDGGFMLKYDLEKVLDKKVPSRVLTDSESLFKVII